jgi:hypothetical protein
MVADHQRKEGYNQWLIFLIADFLMLHQKVLNRKIGNILITGVSLIFDF